jgi:predicted Rossmann fold nucleotide-binding protein DprA/Smf involved in DNA uptake
MTEIAQLFESALRNNRASLLRKAAMNTLAKMPPGTSLRELLDSDAGQAVRELTLRDLGEALEQAGYRPAAGHSRGASATGTPSRSAQWEESREERIFREILAAIEDEPLTIGQLAKCLDVDIEELRGYLAWMKKAGKVLSSGRARATRYQPAPAAK